MSPRRVLAEHNSRDLAEWMAFFRLEHEKQEARKSRPHDVPTKPVPNLKAKLDFVLGRFKKKKSE